MCRLWHVTMQRKTIYLCLLVLLVALVGTSMAGGGSRAAAFAHPANMAAVARRGDTAMARKVTEGPFSLSDSTMWYQTHDNLITYKKWIRTPWNKIPTQLPACNPPPDFVLRGHVSHFLNVIRLSCVWCHMVLSLYLNTKYIPFHR